MAISHLGQQAFDFAIWQVFVQPDRICIVTCRVVTIKPSSADDGLALEDALLAAALAALLEPRT